LVSEVVEDSGDVVCEFVADGGGHALLGEGCLEEGVGGAKEQSQVA
jgi:hypothetical protein